MSESIHYKEQEFKEDQKEDAILLLKRKTEKDSHHLLRGGICSLALVLCLTACNIPSNNQPTPTEQAPCPSNKIMIQPNANKTEEFKQHLLLHIPGC